jgi:hypothetical protein
MRRLHLRPARARGLIWPVCAEAAGYASGLLLLVAVLALPLALWPYDAINEQLTWDAGLYPCPRRALLVGHSSWDLSIAYGEYPLGYGCSSRYPWFSTAPGC